MTRPSATLGEDPFGLAGRTAVVTGGARGLGAAVVERLEAAGARGVVLDVDESRQVPAGWSCVQVDLGDDAAALRAFAAVAERLRGLDVVVAAAGIVPSWSSVRDLRFADWDSVFDVNVRGLAATLRSASPLMRPGGSFVAIGSINSWRGDRNLMSYVASKHAVLGIVRSAALELGPLGVRVNAVAPGPIATEALLGRIRSRSAAGGLSEQEALDAAAAETALGRMATADEVASATLFLASPLSSGITGQMLPVDAGVR